MAVGQNVRLEARRLVQEQLLRRREEQAAREARIRAHALGATMAAVERDQVLVDTERRIAEALVALTVTEEVSVSEAAALCGLEVREANRLRRLHHHHSDQSTPSDPDPAPAP